MSAAERPVSLTGTRSAISRLGVVWPVLASALVLLAFAGSTIAGSHGNPAALVQFGRLNTHNTHPPAGDPIAPSWGYDGQIYWLQATDPLLLHASTAARLEAVAPAYRLQRPAYPALAWLLAGGRVDLLAWSLLAINVFVVLGLTFGFAVYARRRSWNPAWALVIGVAPGLVIGTTRDLSDVMATGVMLLGLLAFHHRRAWLAGVLLAIAALTREPMLLAAPAVALAVAGDAWTSRSVRGGFAALRRGGPTVVLPVAAYFGWGTYLRTLPSLPHTAALTGDSLTLPPFRPIITSAQQVITSGSLPHELFVLPYLGLTVAGIAAAVWLLRRGTSAAAWMAVLYGLLVLPVTFLADDIALTRYTVPLFLCLLLAGLEHRSRPALAIAAGSAAMTLMLPLIAL